MNLRRVSATVFLNSMKEGGSRPALVKADDGGLYVAKLRGAAQGVGPLAAEIIVGQLAEKLGLLLPEIVLVDLPADFGVGEPDPELRDLLRDSRGTNVGLSFVPEAVMFDPAAADGVPPELAAAIIWLDALVLNIDRTATNPNLLQRGDSLYLIDHGAALYFHFHWEGFAGKSQLPFSAIRQHVLLPWAGDIRLAGRIARAKLDAAAIGEIIAAIPDDLFAVTDSGPDAAAQRTSYTQFLNERLQASDVFESEIERAHEESL